MAPLYAKSWGIAVTAVTDAQISHDTPNVIELLVYLLIK
jgi:hypothetical protein